MVKGLQAGWGTCSRTVSFDKTPQTLACWKDLITVGFNSGDIIILDAVTGIHMSILCGHSACVYLLEFSLDGIFLASVGEERTVKLWDMQTGGVIKIYSHTSHIISVSISPDCTKIAKAISHDGACGYSICLWDIQTGECPHIIYRQQIKFNSITFSPTNSQLLLSASSNKTIQKWDVDGHEIGPIYEGSHVDFSPDGALFISWGSDRRIARVRNFDSGAVIAELDIGATFSRCCFSSDGKLVAGSNHITIYVWNITGLVPHHIGTFVGHTGILHSLAFSPSLISLSEDRSIRFWQIGTTPMDPGATNSESTPLVLAPTISMHLQASDGIAILVSDAGVVRTWDLSTGLCKASFHTSAGPQSKRDIQFIDGKLIFIWCTHKKIHIWSPKKENCHTMAAISDFSTTKLRISGDGSNFFLLDHQYIQALSTQTGEVMGKVGLEGKPSHVPLVVDGSKVWVYFEDLQTKGWDFGVPGSTPVLLSNAPPDPERPRLNFISGSARIKDKVTGKEVFQLPERYVEPTIVQWDGQFLVASYKSGELLILDFIHMIPQ